MTLNYKVFGEEQDEDIIILHGLFGMLDNWQTFAKQLAKKSYRVWIIDQRNHGKSPHSDEFDYSILANDLLDFMDEHGLLESYIMGHSMGGKTALQFLANYPERVKKLIVVDIAPKNYPPHHNDILDALQNCNLDIVQKRSDAEAQLATTIKDTGVRLFLMKNLTRNPEGKYRWKMNLYTLIKHYESILATTDNHGMTITTEVLFVRGIKSHYISEDDILELPDTYINASFVSLDAGHWVHAERPQELLESILDFL